jgi:hypothetical protein
MYQIEIRNRMESNRIQALKGSPTETNRWNQTETCSGKNRIQPKPKVEWYQTKNRNRMESNRNQELGNCHKPKNETELNQTENRYTMESNRNNKLKCIKPTIEIE